MISKRCWLGVVLWGLGTFNLQAYCEESSRSSSPGGEEFFIICQSNADDPVKYVLTKFISDRVMHGVLSFRAGRKGFYCASDDHHQPICHASNFGLVPTGEFRSREGDIWNIQTLSGFKPIENPDVSYPRDNIIRSSDDCYLAIKDRNITLGVREDHPYGLERCLVALGQVKR